MKLDIYLLRGHEVWRLAFNPACLQFGAPSLRESQHRSPFSSCCSGEPNGFAAGKDGKGSFEDGRNRCVGNPFDRRR